MLSVYDSVYKDWAMHSMTLHTDGADYNGKMAYLISTASTLPIYVGQISLTKIYLSFSCTFTTRPVWILIINAK